MIKEIRRQNENDKLLFRPPVVVILGHVDHGKTSLLNVIRQLSFTDHKPGGVITQHIGAYEIKHKGKKITFLDTPGHEAFSMMRARGAEVADIAVLVVDTLEGPKEQTKEAVLAVKKAGIPMIVALNKIDKPLADPERTKRNLSEIGVLVESMGGDIPSVEVSAKTKKGIEDLLELILLVAEMEEIKTNIEVPAEGVVIESYLDNFRGPVATLILKNGLLKERDIISTPSAWAKIKALENYQGEKINKAFPSQPVVVLGFEKVPGVGEIFKSYSSEEEVISNIKEEKKDERPEVIMSSFEEDKKILNIILKSDVLGSLEAIETTLRNLPQEKVVLRFLKKGVGEINSSDIELAETAKAQIIGFRTKIDSSALRVLKKYKKGEIKIKIFEVIYELIQGVRQIMEKILEPETVRVETGRVEVLVIFKTQRTRQIIGGKVIEGEIRNGLKIEVFRKEEKVGAGKIINLQKNKKDVEKLTKGEECGVLYEGNIKIQQGDILVFFTEEKRRVEL